MEWESAKLATMLASPAARGRAIENLLQFVRDHGCVGVSIDFENVPAAAQLALKTFMHELYAQFHPLGLEVSQSVPLNDPAFDYRGLASATDYLILMAYDEHWSSSKAGPIEGYGLRDLEPEGAKLGGEFVHERLERELCRRRHILKINADARPTMRSSRQRV